MAGEDYMKKIVILIIAIILVVKVYAGGSIYYADTPTGKDVEEKIQQALTQLPEQLIECVRDIRISNRRHYKTPSSGELGGFTTTDKDIVIVYEEGVYRNDIYYLLVLAHEAAHACKMNRVFDPDEKQKLDEYRKETERISETQFNNWKEWLEKKGLSFEEYKQLTEPQKKDYVKEYNEENKVFIESLKISDDLMKEIYEIVEQRSEVTMRWKRCFMDASDRVINMHRWNSTYLGEGEYQYDSAFGSPRPYAQSRKCGCEDTSVWVEEFYSFNPIYRNSSKELAQLLNSTKTCTVYANFPTDLTLVEENCCAIAKHKLKVIADYGWIPTDSSGYLELKQLADKCQPKTTPCGAKDDSTNSENEGIRRRIINRDGIKQNN